MLDTLPDPAAAHPGLLSLQALARAHQQAREDDSTQPVSSQAALPPNAPMQLPAGEDWHVQDNPLSTSDTPRSSLPSVPVTAREREQAPEATAEAVQRGAELPVPWRLLTEKLKAPARRSRDRQAAPAAPAPARDSWEGQAWQDPGPSGSGAGAVAEATLGRDSVQPPAAAGGSGSEVSSSAAAGGAKASRRPLRRAPSAVSSFALGRTASCGEVTAALTGDAAAPAAGARGGNSPAAAARRGSAPEAGSAQHAVVRRPPPMLAHSAPGMSPALAQRLLHGGPTDAPAPPEVQAARRKMYRIVLLAVLRLIADLEAMAATAADLLVSRLRLLAVAVCSFCVVVVVVAVADRRAVVVRSFPYGSYECPTACNSAATMQIDCRESARPELPCPVCPPIHWHVVKHQPSEPAAERSAVHASAQHCSRRFIDQPTNA